MPFAGRPAARHRRRRWQHPPLECAGRFRARNYPLPGKALAVAFSADGKTLAVSGGKGTISSFDHAYGPTRTILPGHTLAVLSVAFTPDGNKLVSAAGL